jgi:hypothetical protein
MDCKEALAYISRYAPCAHESADTGCGNGKIWAQCDNCDSIFLQESWDNSKLAAKKFDSAIGILAAMIRNND